MASAQLGTARVHGRALGVACPAYFNPADFLVTTLMQQLYGDKTDKVARRVLHRCKRRLNG